MIKRVTHGSSLQSRALDRGSLTRQCYVVWASPDGDPLRRQKKQNLRKEATRGCTEHHLKMPGLRLPVRGNFALTSVFTRAKLRDSVWIAKGRGCGVNFSQEWLTTQPLPAPLKEKEGPVPSAFQCVGCQPALDLMQPWKLEASGLVPAAQVQGWGEQLHLG